MIFLSNSNESIFQTIQVKVFILSIFTKIFLKMMSLILFLYLIFFIFDDN